MDKLIEGLFKILIITIVISMDIIFLPPIYCLGILWLMYCGCGNFIDCVNELNDEVKKEVIKPLFELIKEYLDE